MGKKYDRYELEIIISLGFLILFLISTNFISGYSFERAIQGQAMQFDKAANIAANFIRAELEKDVNKWTHSNELLLERLRDLSMLTDIENITVSDTSDRIIGEIASARFGEEAGSILTLRRPLRLSNGRIAAYLTIVAANPMGDRFDTLSRWDAVFRAAGLIAALIVAAYFIRAVLYPYQRIKREALDYNLDLKDTDSGKGIEYIIDTFKDVISELEDKKTRLETMYKNSEKRADSLARYNEYILGSISSGVVICDSKGIVTRFNRSAENILRYFEKECRGKHYREIFGQEHRLTSMLDEALIEGAVHSRLEFEVRRPDGEILWLGCSSSMINDEKGEGMGAVLLMIDLTEIRRLQELSSYSEKMASLGEMSAGIAHEIRNSFAAVVGFAGLAKKSGNLGNKAAKLVDAIREESIATEALLSRFLNFARPLDLSPEAINIPQLIDSTLEHLSHSNLEIINIKCRLCDDIPMFIGDPVLLRQALTNLLLNACDALTDGGDISLDVKVEKKKTDGMSDLLISVADNGAGIASESLDKIFEPFHTDKPHGTGLGLALVKKIVVLHEGRIDVHSKPGKGTRFTIHLPINMKSERPQTKKAVETA